MSKPDSVKAAYHKEQRYLKGYVCNICECLVPPLASRAAAGTRRCVDCHNMKKHEYRLRANAKAAGMSVAEYVAHKEAIKQQAVDAALAERVLKLFKRIDTDSRPWSGLSKADSKRMRYALDVDYALKERLRTQLYKTLSAAVMADLTADMVSGNSVEYLTGHTIQEHKDNIESRFVSGMSWAEFMEGNIDIDHIAPKRFFKLDTLEGVRHCWSTRNLQPLWSTEHRAKTAIERRVLIY